MKKTHCKSKHCQRHNVKYPSSIHLLKDDNYIKIMIKKSDDYDYGDGDAQAHMMMMLMLMVMLPTPSTPHQLCHLPIAPP